MFLDEPSCCESPVLIKVKECPMCEFDECDEFIDLITEIDQER